MNKIAEKFEDIRNKGSKALIAYFTAGYPSVKATIDIVKKAELSGADIVELGIPFSDPVADGPVIQHASFKALEKGMNTDKIFNICRMLKESVKIPYLLMTYYNPVYKYGVSRFAKKCAATGVSGIIIPDLPYEESAEIRTIMRKNGIILISFLTPFTPEKRAKKILKDAEGFVYYITSPGVTGQRKEFSPLLLKKIKKAKAFTNIPIAAGFGISSVKQVKSIKESVDGVIIGSFFVQCLIDGKIDKLWKKIKKFKSEL